MTNIQAKIAKTKLYKEYTEAFIGSISLVVTGYYLIKIVAIIN